MTTEPTTETIPWESIPWERFPRLRRIFEYRPVVNVYWQELIELVKYLKDKV